VEIQRIELEFSLGKTVNETPISTNKPGVVIHACNPSYVGSIGRRMIVQDWPYETHRPYLKNN
jgi:hypothetical protein